MLPFRVFEMEWVVATFQELSSRVWLGAPATLPLHLPDSISVMGPFSPPKLTLLLPTTQAGPEGLHTACSPATLPSPQPSHGYLLITTSSWLSGCPAYTGATTPSIQHSLFLLPASIFSLSAYHSLGDLIFLVHSLFSHPEGTRVTCLFC